MSVTAVTKGRVLTMDPARTVLERGTVLCEGPHIIAVGAQEDIVIPADAEIIDASGHVIMPGLINAHTHSAQVLLRGGVASQDRGLFDWLTSALYPGLDAYGLDDLGVARALFGIEALRSGTTCIVDNHEGFPDSPAAAATASVESYRDLGIRVMYARMQFDQPRQDAPGHPSGERIEFARPTDAVIGELDRLMHTYAGVAGGRIQVWPAPAHPSAASERLMTACRDLARPFDTSWTMHLSNRRVDRAPGLVHTLHASGLIDERLLAAHCIGIEEDEVELLARVGTRVVTNPVANAYLAMGSTPLSVFANCTCSMRRPGAQRELWMLPGKREPGSGRPPTVEPRDRRVCDPARAPRQLAPQRAAARRPPRRCSARGRSRRGGHADRCAPPRVGG